MGDVTCARCGEPWDCFHLRHDEVHETEAGGQMIGDKLDEEDWDKKMCQWGGLSREAALKACGKFEPQYKGERWEGRLTDFWRSQFEARGWKFGSSVYAVLTCPCCDRNNKLPGAEGRMEDRLIVSELLEGDDDGIAATLEDLAITEASR